MDFSLLIPSYKIHVWNTYLTYIYHEFMVNVGKYTSPMDPISMVTLSTCLNIQEGHIKNTK